jgi:hypothetical protein
MYDILDFLRCICNIGKYWEVLDSIEKYQAFDIPTI